MKYLLGILLAASVAVTGYAQDPGTNFSNGSNGDYGYNDDYTQSSTKGSPESQDKFDANSSRDMNNSSNMNNPLYMENGTLAEPKTERDAYANQAGEVDDDPDGSKAGNALDKAGAKSKKGISKGWYKVKHNKLTKNLFNQPGDN
jgi:hypothetical protein